MSKESKRCEKAKLCSATLTSTCFFLALQILRQYPLSFEFNEYFLHFLAYHHVSMRFRTFLLDSEHERQQMGWLSDDENGEKQPRNSKSHGKSLWDYVDKLRHKSSLFYNFKYSKYHSAKVGIPTSCFLLHLVKTILKYVRFHIRNGLYFSTCRSLDWSIFVSIWDGQTLRKWLAFNLFQTDTKG